MTGNPPRVSVIIPVHNCERYLGEAMESVLTQTYKSFELIVVDDGSTDATARVARGFASSVRYCFQQQRGAGAARNRGVEMAQGRHLAFLDADDLWLEGKLARQLEAFEADPGLDMVFGQVEHFVSPELDEDFKRTLRCPAKLMPGYAPSAMMVKRNSFYAVGPFETHWRVAEFIDWYSKA